MFRKIIKGLEQNLSITLSCVSKLFYKGQGFSNNLGPFLHAEFKNSVHFSRSGLVSKI